MKSRFYALDILRFVLAALVVVLHFFEVFGYSVIQDAKTSVSLLGIPIYHATFTHAVDVFFVLSGFTIFYSTRKITSMQQFFQKRAARIFPIFWIATFLSIPLFLMISSSANERTLSITYLLNNLILRPDTQPFLVSVAWTLSFEWVFYMIFAVGLKISHKYRAEVVSAIFIVFTILTLFLAEPKSGYLNVLFNDRMMLIEFIAGMYIAKYYDKFKLKQGFVYCLVGALLLYGMLWTPFFTDKYRGFIMVIPSVLIVLGALFINVPEKFHTLARKMGDISYTMYIIHTFTAFSFGYFLYSLLRIRSYPWFWMIISLLLTIGVSLFVHHYIEKPLYSYFSGARKSKR